MKRNISDLSVFVAIVLALAAFFISGWMAASGKGSLLTSGLPAMLMILACCVPLYFIHQWILPGASIVTALFYAFLAPANPVSFCLSPFHVVALLSSVTLYCYLCFTALRPALKYAAGLWITFGFAVQLLPSLLWMAPVLLLSSIGKAPEKGKYCFITLLGLTLPPIAWMAIRYLVNGALPFSGYFPVFWTETSTLHLPSTNLPIVTLCRIGFTVLLTVMAFLHILPKLSRFSIVQFRAVLRLLLLAICLTIYAFLFLDYPARPVGLLVMLPVAPLLSIFMLYPFLRKDAGYWLFILLLLLAVERISLFVNL